VIGFEKIVNGSAKEFFRPLSTPKLLNINFSTVENQFNRKAYCESGDNEKTSPFYRSDFHASQTYLSFGGD
jgi:hypothetical protein